MEEAKAARRRFFDATLLLARGPFSEELGIHRMMIRDILARADEIGFEGPDDDTSEGRNEHEISLLRKE